MTDCIDATTFVKIAENVKMQHFFAVQTFIDGSATTNLQYP